MYVWNLSAVCVCGIFWSFSLTSLTADSGDPDLIYKSRFIVNSISCDTIRLTYGLTTNKSMLLDIVKQFMRGMVNIYCGPLKFQVRL